jgi:hypothetical protein
MKASGPSRSRAWHMCQALVAASASRHYFSHPAVTSLLRSTMPLTRIVRGQLQTDLTAP